MVEGNEAAVHEGPEDPAHVGQRQRDPEPGPGRGEWLRPARQVAQQPRREVPGGVDGGPGIEAKTAGTSGVNIYQICSRTPEMY